MNKRKLITELLKESANLKLLLIEKCDKIEEIVDIVIEAYKKGKKVILFGNGGSAADAQHISAELVGRFKKDRKALPAITLTTNTSVLTALSNDYGFDIVFSRQVDAVVEDGDVVIAISTSGNSPNVLKGVDAARRKGAKTVGLTGKDGGKLKDMVDIAIVVPSDKTARIQEGHITIGHIICELVESELFEENR